MYNLLIDNEVDYASDNRRHIRSGRARKALGLFIERSCKTEAAGPVFVAPLMDSEFVVEDYRPIRVTRHDKKTASMQHTDESIVMIGGRLVAISIYTGRQSIPRILRGSI